MAALAVNSIYLATEGEGLRIGEVQVFIRLQGCNIGCLNCDSKDTWDFDSHEKIAVEDIVHVVKKHGVKAVSITGGDPTHPIFEKDLIELIASLKKSGLFINMEASGTRLAHALFDGLDFISFDFKTPSSGVQTKLENIVALAKSYPGRFQIKSVVEDRRDFDYILENKLKLEEVDFPWVITPSYNTEEEFPQERFQQILEWNYEAAHQFRVIGQQHKWIFGSRNKLV